MICAGGVYMKPGDKFGRWTVVGLSEKKGYVRCKCDCGTIKDVGKSDLKSGKSKSCGCLSLEKKRQRQFELSDKQILGKKFGRLTPMKRVNTKGPSFYECKCDCGKYIETRGGDLIRGKVNSCGCLKSERDSKHMRSIAHQGHEVLDEYRYQGTSILSIKQGLSKNNTSGYKGVSLIKKTGRYRAYITLRGKRKHIGIFDTAEEADQARIEAEKKYFQPIIDEFNEENKQ